METTKRLKIDISFSTLLKILLVIAGVLFVIKIQSILLELFVVLIFVTALSPWIENLSAYLKIPRWVSVALTFAVILIILVAVVALIVPLIVSQVIDLLSLPQIKNLLGANEANTFLDELRFISAKIPSVGFGSADSFFGFASSLFGGVVTFITVLVLSFYLLLEEDGVKKFVLSLLPVNHREKIVTALHKVGTKLGSWLRGQLLVCIIVGLLDAVILLIFGVPFWLTLAVFAAFVEFIPYVGPFVATAAAIFVALTRDSFWGINSITVAIGVLIGYIVIQQVESHLLIPKVMQKSVGLSPVIVIVAILIGAELFGLVGIILSVPVAAVVAVAVDEWPAVYPLLFNRHSSGDPAKE